MTDAEVLRKPSLLPVQLLLRIERIKFAAGLFGKAREELRRLAADENGNDPACGKILTMPPYSCQPEEWLKLWADFPGAWKLLVKRFAQRLQESCCPSQDGDIADAGQLAHVPSDLDGVHTCTDCGRQFASNCGLAVQTARVHGVRRPAPSYAGWSATCAPHVLLESAVFGMVHLA